jgi:transcriptional regulator with XRE-family HTH domain
MSVQKPLGRKLRELRQRRNEPLRVVAAVVEIDSSLLSKIEHGERFPTAQQLEKFAEYFEISLEELTAQTIAEKILSSYAPNSITLQALKIAESRISAYLVDNDD